MAESKTKGKKIGMNTNDKTQRITIRLNAEEHAFLESNADLLGITPSELLRQVIHVSMRTTAEASKKMDAVVVETADKVKSAKADLEKNVSRETKTTTKGSKRPTKSKEK